MLNNQSYNFSYDIGSSDKKCKIFTVESTELKVLFKRKFKKFDYKSQTQLHEVILGKCVTYFDIDSKGHNPEDAEALQKNILSESLFTLKKFYPKGKYYILNRSRELNTGYKVSFRIFCS